AEGRPDDHGNRVVGGPPARLSGDVEERVLRATRPGEVHFARLQISTVVSAPPVASVFPSGENAMEATAPSCPASVSVSRALATSKSLRTPSSPPAASVRPSWENAIAPTPSSFPPSAPSGLPLAASNRSTDSRAR